MRYFPDVAEIAPGTWRLDVADLVVQTLGYTLVVPMGFITDLASVPRALWSIIAPFELGLAGPIVHDWLYRHGGNIACVGAQSPLFNRAQADAILRDIMRQDGISRWRCTAGYLGVRVGGASSWQPIK